MPLFAIIASLHYRNSYLHKKNFYFLASANPVGDTFTHAEKAISDVVNSVTPPEENPTHCDLYPL